MNAIILSVGDELTLGQTVDTNSAWLSQELAQVGISVLAHITVGDDQSAIEQAIRESAERCDLLLISGGIGPTPDDLTRQALAAVMNQPLELNEKWLAELTGFFAKRNRPMPEMNRIQAMIPRGSEMIWNHAGTAAGIHAVMHVGSASADAANPTASAEADPTALRTQHSALSTHKCEAFVMPGVPKEMKLMFERAVLKKLKPDGGGAVILTKTLHTFGLGESAVAELLGGLMDRTRNPTVGTTVSGGVVSVRVNSRFDSKDDAQRQLDDTVKECYSKLADLIFGEDETTLPQAVAKLLLDSKKTVTTAESCTGGLLAKYLTDIPGSSAYLKQGWITYSNEAKSAQLGIHASAIAEHGAVSEQTVRLMALGALKVDKTADYAIAISGIAGPDGGTPAKPVGTVCIAFAVWGDDHPFPGTNGGVYTRTFLFPGDREMIRDRSAKMALTMLRFHLLGKPMPF